MQLTGSHDPRIELRVSEAQEALETFGGVAVVPRVNPVVDIVGLGLTCEAGLHERHAVSLSQQLIVYGLRPMGQFLRHGVPKPHVCDRPQRARHGAVWRCDCGRRWTCVAEAVNMPGLLAVDEAQWERRYWPWPRRPKPHPGDFIVPVTADWLPKVPSGPAQGETCGLVHVDTEQLVGNNG